MSTWLSSRSVDDVGISWTTVTGGAALFAAGMLARGLFTERKRMVIIPSPRSQLLPKLSQEAISKLPYPPDALPGARDIPSPYGSIRAYEFGPEDGRKVLMIHGISTPCLALGAVAHGLVDKGCRVMLFDLYVRHSGIIYLLRRSSNSRVKVADLQQIWERLLRQPSRPSPRHSIVLDTNTARVSFFTTIVDRVRIWQVLNRRLQPRRWYCNNLYLAFSRSCLFTGTYSARRPAASTSLGPGISPHLLRRRDTRVSTEFFGETPVKDATLPN